jgi:hypothetical protein
VIGSIGAENAVENMRTTAFVTLVLTGCPVSLLGALILASCAWLDFCNANNHVSCSACV